MNQVITKEQAHQITGGREPFGIVEYEQAVALLRQCLTIDDAKRFATFADAKTAWAKVHHDQSVQRLAKALKLEAARHMGLLAEKERPSEMRIKGIGSKGGQLPGARSLLIESGLSRTEAKGAMALTRMTPKEFRRLIASENPPAITSLPLRRDSDWQPISLAISAMVSMVRTKPAALSARYASISGSQQVITSAIERVTEISEWCDEFLQRLPKERP